MKIGIIYFSKHKGNTEKLILKSTKNFNVDIINGNNFEFKNLDYFDILGLASGIYKGNVDENCAIDANTPAISKESNCQV